MDKYFNDGGAYIKRWTLDFFLNFDLINYCICFPLTLNVCVLLVSFSSFFFVRFFSFYFNIHASCVFLPVPLVILLSFQVVFPCSVFILFCCMHLFLAIFTSSLHTYLLATLLTLHNNTIGLRWDNFRVS